VQFGSGRRQSALKAEIGRSGPNASSDYSDRRVAGFILSP
jgi:hypothetical protein